MFLVKNFWSCEFILLDKLDGVDWNVENELRDVENSVEDVQNGQECDYCTGDLGCWKGVL